MPVDLVQRFSQTPLVAILRLNGNLVRVATNDQLLLDRFRVESTELREDNGDAPTADWRIVVELDSEQSNGEFALHSFEHDGLSFTRIAQRSFVAGDRQTRSGISFITCDLIRAERLFSKYFLPAFVSILEGMKGEKWNAS
jgi:hypothetical protein